MNLGKEKECNLNAHSVFICIRTLGNWTNNNICTWATGKVKRVFSTLQNRVLSEFRIGNVQTIEQADVEIQKYVEKHNLKQISFNNDILSAKEKDSDIKNVDNLLSVKDIRWIHQSHIRFKNDYYFISHDGEMKNYKNRLQVRLWKLWIKSC